jgi:hypothetical protein
MYFLLLFFLMCVAIATPKSNHPIKICHLPPGSSEFCHVMLARDRMEQELLQKIFRYFDLQFYKGQNQ